MKSAMFGTIMAGAVAGLLVGGTAQADNHGAAAGGAKCVHTCSGLAACKGEGNDSCAGKNACGGQGKTNKKCAAAKAKKDCDKVKDKGKAICEWKEG